MLSQNEKRGNFPQPVHLIKSFREAVDDFGLIEICMVGHPFTWERARGRTNWVEERLDRVEVWNQLFPSTYVLNEDAYASVKRNSIYTPFFSLYTPYHTHPMFSPHLSNGV